ncbi:MAG: ECF transporter S component [Lachnospiraceae bacterium]|nr:ECF transporter S component [Lachnospiraceae bacterium]
MKNSITTRKITVAALFMAMNIALSSYGIPVPGGHLYLCDVVICTAAILLDPFHAFVVGGVGSFLGDFFFYPAPMFVSLATHGLQAVVISLCAHKLFKKHSQWGAVIGVTVGAVIMVIGYTLGRAFVYSTPEYSIAKLPYEILQAAVGAVAGIILCYPCGLRKVYGRFFANNMSESHRQS